MIRIVVIIIIIKQVQILCNAHQKYSATVPSSVSIITITVKSNSHYVRSCTGTAGQRRTYTDGTVCMRRNRACWSIWLHTHTDCSIHIRRHVYACRLAQILTSARFVRSFAWCCCSIYLTTAHNCSISFYRWSQMISSAYKRMDDVIRSCPTLCVQLRA